MTVGAGLCSARGTLPLSRAFPIKAVNFPLLRIFVYVLPNLLVVWLITDNVFIVTALPELAAWCLHGLIGGLCGK